MYYYRLISSMLKSTVSSLLTGLYAVYKAESNGLTSLLTNLYAVYKAESNGNDALGSYNAVSVSGGVTYTAGKSGSQFNFNGVTGVITLPTNSFKFTGDFSFSFWMYPTLITSTRCIFVNDTYSAPNEKGFRILQRDSRLELKIYNNTTTVTLITGSVFSVNTSYFCTVTHSSTGNEITINGVSQVTDTNSTNAIFATTSIPYVGVNQGTGFAANSYFEGRIDELYAWDRKITPTEITELYNSGAGKFYQTNAFYSTVVNDSLGNYNGTAQSELTYTAGKSGNAFTGNGTNAYVLLPTNSFKLSSNFSISAWIYINDFGVVSAIFSNAQTVLGLDYGYKLDVDTTQKVRFSIYNGATLTRYTSASLITINTWTHLVISRTASTDLKMYINGVSDTYTLSGLKTLDPLYDPTMNNVNIGAYSGSSQFFKNKIDEVYIWTKDITATEVTELYNSGAGKFYPY